jgi:hypothetical protein
MTEGTQKTLDRKPDELASGGGAALGERADVLSRDLLRGADTIAEFVFGNKAERRKIYHLAETSRLPVFRLGSVLCARRSVLMAWIAEQEKRGLRGTDADRGGSTTVTNSPKE